VSRRGPEREHVVAELGGLLTIAARWCHSRRTLVETTVLAEERGQYRLMQPPQAIQLPATIQVTLAGRIDRLAQED
jgi:ATP-dependent helicase/DNAse subunit B